MQPPHTSRSSPAASRASRAPFEGLGGLAGISPVEMTTIEKMVAMAQIYRKHEEKHRARTNTAAGLAAVLGEADTDIRWRAISKLAERNAIADFNAAYPA